MEMKKEIMQLVFDVETLKGTLLGMVGYLGRDDPQVMKMYDAINEAARKTAIETMRKRFPDDTFNEV